MGHHRQARKGRPRVISYSIATQTPPQPPAPPTQKGLQEEGRRRRRRHRRRRGPGRWHKVQTDNADYDGVGVTLMAPAQFLAGAALGGLGGYLDSVFVEPFGLAVGSSLFLAQVLDYSGYVRLPWNPRPPPESSVGLVPGFVATNAATAGGFVTGYFMGGLSSYLSYDFPKTS